MNALSPSRMFTAPKKPSSGITLWNRRWPSRLKILHTRALSPYRSREYNDKSGAAMRKYHLCQPQYEAARQLQSKLLAVMLGAAAACLMGAGAHAAPGAPAMTLPAADQHAIVDGHRIQPRRGTSDADHLDRDDTQTIEDLYRGLMTMGANGPATENR
jgi:hypothetical protein